jgi:hypothetical protein
MLSERSNGTHSFGVRTDPSGIVMMRSPSKRISSRLIGLRLIGFLRMVTLTVHSAGAAVNH